MHITSDNEELQTLMISLDITILYLLKGKGLTAKQKNNNNKKSVFKFTHLLST